MKGTFFAHICYGTLVSSHFLLPFFIRSIFLRWMAEREASVSQESTDSQKTLKDLVISISLPEDQEARDVLNLPLDNFAARVLTGDLPRDFYDTAPLAELEGYPVLECHNYIAGTFKVLPELVPKELRDMHSDWGVVVPDEEQMLSESNTTCVIPLKHQSSIFEGGEHYKDEEEVSEEARESIAALGVEVPSDYHFWPCIGVISAVGWNGDCWCKLLMQA